MSKGGSGHFSGTVGAKAAGGGSGNSHPLFNNGHVTETGIREHREEFMGKSVEQIAEMMKQNGYSVEIVDSKLKSRGSKAKIIKVLDPQKEQNIRQVQVSPGGGIHGKDPYVKISTDKKRIKVIDGKPEDYKNGENEKAVRIFRRDNE